MNIGPSHTLLHAIGSTPSSPTPVRQTAAETEAAAQVSRSTAPAVPEPPATAAVADAATSRPVTAPDGAERADAGTPQRRLDIVV